MSTKIPKLLKHTRQVCVFVSGGFIKRTCLVASGTRKEIWSRKKMRVNERREGVDYIWLHLIVLQMLESQLQPLNAFCHANNRHKTLQCNRKATKKSDGKEAQRQCVLCLILTTRLQICVNVF